MLLLRYFSLINLYPQVKIDTSKTNSEYTSERGAQALRSSRLNYLQNTTNSGAQRGAL